MIILWLPFIALIFKLYILHIDIRWKYVCVHTFRVRGIKGLRIIDASIVPSSLSGNSYTTQVMIAEKAADIVREKDTVKAIKEYFKHLLETKHKRIMEEEEQAQGASDNDNKPKKK